jgi:hypothetical protein
LGGERAVHAGIERTGLRPDLSESPDQHCDNEKDGREQDDSPGSRSSTGATMGEARQHRRVTLLPGQTAGNGASDVEFRRRHRAGTRAPLDGGRDGGNLHPVLMTIDQLEHPGDHVPSEQMRFQP